MRLVSSFQRIEICIDIKVTQNAEIIKGLRFPHAENEDPRRKTSRLSVICLAIIHTSSIC